MEAAFRNSHIWCLFKRITLLLSEHPFIYFPKDSFGGWGGEGVEEILLYNSKGMKKKKRILAVIEVRNVQ